MTTSPPVQAEENGSAEPRGKWGRGCGCIAGVVLFAAALFIYPAMPLFPLMRMESYLQARAGQPWSAFHSAVREAGFQIMDNGGDGWGNQEAWLIRDELGTWGAHGMQLLKKSPVAPVFEKAVMPQLVVAYDSTGTLLSARAPRKGEFATRPIYVKTSPRRFSF